jgi:hypothetical protein
MVYCTLWPSSIRPNADNEARAICEWLGAFASFELKEVFAEYQLPHFEKISALASGKPLNRRFAHLLAVSMNGVAAPEIYDSSTRVWHRYIIDDQQLAILVDEQNDYRAKAPEDMEEPDSFTTLGDTSRRNRLLDRINLWSSSNRVGHLRNPGEFVVELDSLIHRSPASLTPQARSLATKFLELPELAPEVVRKWEHRE